MSAEECASPRNSFYFKASDAELVKQLVEYRFLQPDDFQKLTQRNIISLRRRLLQLVRRGYLERFTLPLERDAPIGNPPDAFVYQLSASGIRKAREYGFADESHRATREKSNILLPHEMLITRVHLALARAMQETPLELIAWEQRRAILLDWAENRGKRLSVNPDALFGIKNGEKPEGQNTSYFFLEIVRSRESDYRRGESYFMRKMAAFAAYHREARHTARYGIRNFRVIVVTPTIERARNLCQKLQKAGLASARFWFTDLTAVSPEAPNKILEKIFITPKAMDEGAVYSFRD